MSALTRLLVAVCVICGAFTSRADAAERWTEVRSPNFRVITNGSARDAREVAANFERLQLVLQKTLRIATRSDVPLTIVAVKTGRQLQALLDTTRDDFAGVFAPGYDANVVLLRLDLEREVRYRVAYHEYMHLIVHQTMGVLPVWLNEGLAEMYSQASLDTDTILLGMPADEHLAELQERTLLPLGTLLAVDHGSPHYNETNRASIFYAQSWALTHFLMLGDGGAHRPKLMAMLGAMDGGAAPLDAAMRAFGDATAFERGFRGYITRYQFPALKDTVPVRDAANAMQARVLSPAESLALQATIAAATGRADAATTLAADAVAADGTLADAWLAQARALRVRGNTMGAEQALEKAVTLGSSDPLAHFGWAELRMSRVPADHPLTDVRSALEKSLALKPDLARAQSLLGFVRARQDRNADSGFELVKQAILLEPGNARHYLVLASLLHTSRNYAEMELVLQRAERTARGAPEKQQVAETRTRLRPRS